MTISVKDGGTFKTVATPSVRSGGVWKAASGVWIKDAGTWKQAYSSSRPSAKIYTGTGASNAISLGYSPDFILIKARASGASSFLFDTSRGVSVALDVISAGAEGAATALVSFDPSGFTVQGTSSLVNAAAATFVTYPFKKESGAFDIVTYTGTGANRTVSHSLGVAPELMIVKNRSAATNWAVYSSASGAGNALILNSNAVPTAQSTYWNSTAPTSSAFSVGTSALTNGNGNNLIAYLFASKAGLSKIGTYVGTGTTSGPTITTGFRPSLVISKGTSLGGDWRVFDSARDTTSPHTIYSALNTTAAEVNSATGGITFTDTSFQLTDSAVANTSGVTYLYLAFA